MVSRTLAIEWPRSDFGPLAGSVVSIIAGTPCTHWMSELKGIRMGLTGTCDTDVRYQLNDLAAISCPTHFSGRPERPGRFNLSKALVLVVEDELLLRTHAVTLIEEAGFDTLEAGSAKEAIALLETDERIRIVFTDINLPNGMDGLRLAAAIRERWPPVELVLTSGHLRVSREDIPARGCFLPKPYNPQQLIDMLEGFTSKA